MKALKLTLIIMMTLMVLFLIVPLFLPAEAGATGQIVINEPVEKIYEQVNRLQNWEQWSPFETDSTMVNTYTGNERGVGAVRHWKGEKMGEGSITIVKSDSLSSIETQLNFGPQGQGKGQWQFESKNGHTRVQWHLQIDRLKYPFGKWLGLVMPGMMQQMINQGLKQLKVFCEQKQTNDNSFPVPATMKKNG